MADIRTRIAAVIQANLTWEATNLSARLADAVIAELGLHMQYESGRVMYNTKPAACKANGHWKMRIVSPFELYEE